MQKNILYVVAFVVLVLLQIYLLDNISLGIYFHPLIYVAFIIMLPLDMKNVWVMLLSTLMGLTIDLLTGMGGLNVIASTAAGFTRSMVLSYAVGHTSSADDTMPALHRLTPKILLGYIVGVVLLHNTIYFLMESLSFDNLPHTLLRLVVSAATTMVLVWYVVKLFTEKILSK